LNWFEAEATHIGRAMTRQASFAAVVAAYLVTLLVALAAGWAATAVWHDPHPLAVVAVADLVGTAVIFAFSVAMRNSSMYDPYWSVVPPVIALYLLDGGLGPAARDWLVFALVAAWGLRLTYNWARGWPGMHHEDWRYVTIRRNTGSAYWPASFAGIHLFPTVQVFLGCLALYPAMRGERDLGWLDAVALVVTASAIAIEALADEQLRAFVRTSKPGDMMERGLWRFSRHPNYFGEVSFWWGLWLFGVAARPGDWWWTLAGPLAITGMFLFASIPMLDRRNLERRSAYAERMQRVSALVPWPRR
jgi:steroid 5-alpha reductase family enzyme